MKREFFWQLLSEASHELAERNGTDVIFAAPLATLIQRKLRQKLADNTLELAGPIYGPALFPELPPAAHGGLKFRNFLEVFPDLVEVFRGPSGDMVRVVKGSQEVKVEELRARYRGVLVQAMHELSTERNELIVPAVQLAKRLKKLDLGFEPRRVGHSSLVDWLERQTDLIDVSHREYGGRVRLLDSKPQANTAEQDPSMPQVGYLLVDSSDMLAALHGILGGKPSGDQLPQWANLLRFCREQIRLAEWRARYFMTLGKSPADNTEGFKTYLEAVGFKVVQLVLGGEALSMEALLEERLKANRTAVGKMLAAISNRTAHVFVVSHSESIAAPLLELLKCRMCGVRIGVVGFPERMGDGLLKLKDSGLLIIDIERDAKVFKQPIPRRQLISPEAFDPAHYL
jgi:hypothetical protein